MTFTSLTVSFSSLRVSLLRPSQMCKKKKLRGLPSTHCSKTFTRCLVLKYNKLKAIQFLKTTSSGYFCQIRGIWCDYWCISTWFNFILSSRDVLLHKFCLLNRTLGLPQLRLIVTAVASSLLERFISGRLRDLDASKLSSMSTIQRAGTSRTHSNRLTTRSMMMLVRIIVAEESKMVKWSNSRRIIKRLKSRRRIFSCLPSKMGFQMMK